MLIVVRKRKTGDFLEHYFTNNNALDSAIRTLKYENKGRVFTFFSDLGVFSKDKIDYGSRLLVDTILKNESDVSSILDVGCGYGFIGVVLCSFFSSSCLFSDVNKRALHLCKRNIKENGIEGNVVESSIYDNIDGTFDIVVTNPPIRAGKSVVYSILKGAKSHLNKGGRLWFVMRKDHGVKTAIKDLSDVYEIEVMEKDKGFYIIRAKVIDRVP